MNDYFTQTRFIREDNSMFVSQRQLNEVAAMIARKVSDRILSDIRQK